MRCACPQLNRGLGDDEKGLGCKHLVVPANIWSSKTVLPDGECGVRGCTEIGRVCVANLKALANVVLKCICIHMLWWFLGQESYRLK